LVVELKVKPRFKHERSGLDISYALRAEAIAQKSFFMNAADNGLQWEPMNLIPYG
jgi:hypothetical protein